MDTSGVFELAGSRPCWIWVQTCRTPKCDCRAALVVATSAGRDVLLDLREAVRGYREMLDVYTRLHMPVDRVFAQYNLGGVYSKLAMLTTGSEQLDYLRQSPRQLRDSLRTRTRQHLPVDWATSHIGCTLLTWAQVVSGTERKTLANQAIEAFNNALLVRTWEQMPVAWTRTSWKLNQAREFLDEDPDAVVPNSASLPDRCPVEMGLH